uniref:Bassoon presynaptic cytomatrix protein n=1 Tax=Poecilia formosa TaxID=48698 RepID=A0A087YL89_POEFO
DPGPKAGAQSTHGPGDRLASHDASQHAAPQGGQGQGHAARKNLQVDLGGGRTGRSPSVSPDRGSVPTSPYSVPQIAPMPSSKLCPVCKTTDLMGTGDDKPNFNTCTQCRSMVCNQCGFNPNPHLTEVQEWLCLNCQMQRALGMDMTTPRSKSQQQIHSPSHPTQPEPKPEATKQPMAQPHPAPGPTKQPAAGGPSHQQPKLPPGAVPLPGMAKAPSQPDLSRGSPAHHPQQPRQDQTRSAGSSPSRQPPPPEQTFGKLFGFGASLLNQASTLISETTQPQQQQQPPKPAPKPGGPPGPGPGAGKSPGPPAQQGPQPPPQQQQRHAPPESSKPRASCPLCKTNLNIGNASEEPNYNTCTQCHSQVCNMCGFNPTPHLVEKKEWLCLNCQTQRALSGSLGDIPPPAAPSMGSPRAPAPFKQQTPQQKAPSQGSGPRITGPQQQKPTGPQAGPAPQSKGLSQTSPQTKGSAQPPSQAKSQTQPSSQSAKAAPSSNKSAPNHNKVSTPAKPVPTQSKPTGNNQTRKQQTPQSQDSNKSSTQSLSDTGYSSDGISSSQGEITGQIREEGIKLNERGASIPSDINKLESSMKPLLESKSASDPKHRPHSLSVGQERDYNPDEEAGRDESEDDLSCKLRHDYVEDSSESGLSPLPIRQKKSHKDLTDEEYMRRQIMEMSADEEELEEYGNQKTKKTHKTSGESGKERRRLSHQSNSFEEDKKVSEGAYKANEEEDVVMAGGLRRFKTIELNNTNSYNRDIELSNEHDLREPELEMESLTGSPEERSKGDYSSTLPATTPSYTSGTSPTSVSSMEDDSDSSPSRRARLEEAKQQRKARHRSHGPLLPTIEDSSEEDELREEEELLREQEQMRDLEQQRIRSTARKTKRDKEELRAQRRRERSKTPPSNLSPIEDASPTEELRQAAEMEELHRSSCSEYSPSMDSEAEGFEMIGGKLYKSGNEFNLPTYTSLYSPTEKTSAMLPSDKTLKSAEEVYEEMMRKAQLMQKQGQKGASQPDSGHHLDAGTSLTPGSSPTQVTAPMSFSTSGSMHAAQHLSKETQNRMMTQSAKIEGVVGVATTKAQISQAASARQAGNAVPVSNRAGPQRSTQATPDPGSSSLTSKVFSMFKGPSPPVSPTTSPTKSPTHSPSVRPTSGSGRQLPSLPSGATTAPVSHTGAPQRTMSPRLVRQQSSQDSPVMVITLGSEKSSPAKPITVNSSTSPLSSPTQGSCKTLYSSQPPSTSSPTSPQMHSSQQLKHSSQMGHNIEKVNVGISAGATSTQTRASKVVGQSQTQQSTNVVDLRAPMRPAPIIMTDQGMDLTSLASDTRRYSLGAEQSSSRHTAVQPLIMNLNAQEQPHVSVSTPTTVSVTVAVSTFMSQPKQPVIYGDPLQNRVDLGQGVGSAVCLTQSKVPITDPTIPKIDACLENLAFARYNLANQVQPLLMKKDLVVSQTSTGQPVVTANAIPRVSPLAPPSASVALTSNVPLEMYGGVALELKRKPHVMMVQLDENNTSKSGTVTQLVKREEHPPAPPPPPQVLDLTGQLKQENQVACCDVVYKLPFAGTCSGTFSQKPATVSSDKSPTTEKSQAAHPPQPPQFSVSQQQQPQLQPQITQGLPDEHKLYPPPIASAGRLQPSMSDTNLPSMSDAGSYQNPLQGGLAVDLSSMNQGYDGGYLGMGAQYGSYTDLRHQEDFTGPSLPLRRYGSMSNINSDYTSASRDITGSQDSNLAQYSATTAREISRMCAALNTVDQFGSRFGNNPELAAYGAGRGGPLARLNLQQSLASIRANLLYGPDSRQAVNGQALTNLINARQASIRALYPTAMRGGDGMIYSTINTPIASTLPITTQPAPVIRPMPRGIYRPYPAGVTAVPLASLTRLPQLTPRMPLSTQGAYSYPPNQYPLSVTPTGSGVVVQGQPSSAQQVQAQVQAQMQPQQLPAQTEPLSLTQTQPQTQPASQPQPVVLSQGQTQAESTQASSSKLSPPIDAQKNKEDEKLNQQQEQLLQLERERVELEKLRQLRLHEELERDRMELQRHREKEQLLVQREIQELQTIKQQVLQQQQAERETQLIMQREQLAQQRMQLEQIQTQSAIQGVVVGAGAPQGFIICDQTGRVLQQDGQSVQFWQDGQVVQAVVAARPIHSSTSEMSLRSSDKQGDSKTMKKQNSMPRLRDGSEEDSVKRITDSCVQTDDEDGEERYMNRRRRTRRIADCSVQTDEEDQGEWDQQPVRRRRSRVSKHSESSGEAKSDGSSKVISASIAIQTTNDSSCQTESDLLGRVSPAIHITMAETSKVDLLHYIAAPERTHKGESLACQTEPESHSQGVVAPQLSVPTTISPYSTSLHIVGGNTSDTASPRLQGVAKFERRKPDPLEIGYHHQHNESSSRQPPKSPQVLYSPVSPLSPHRMLETTFASQEKLNKAHVTPQQKSFTAESPRHQTLPRPIKSVQRSMSDPKPLSPTSEDPTKNRFSPYHQVLSNSQVQYQQQNSLMRKVKRTLPSPPPEEAPLPIVTPAQMYSSPGMPQRVLPRPAQGVTKAGLLSELKAVEQESSKLRKQQAELEEEEKEIDAKLRYLELGITQRKETMVKERERRELAYLRCMGDPRDYMSDSELNNLRMGAYPSTSSYMPYPYPQTQPSTHQPGSTYQPIGFQTPQYPSSSAPQPGTFQPHPPTVPGYQNQGTYSSRMYGQSSYQTDFTMQQHGHQGFHSPGQPMPGQSLPYPTHSSYQPGLAYQPQAEILTVHQRPRQTSLAELEQKLPTNYEVISNPAVSVATSAPDTNFGPAYSNAYGQYRPPEPGLTHSVDSPTSAYTSDGLYTSNLEQNIPRNYVMIDDISELTKDNTGQPTDALGHPVGGRYRSENGSARATGYEEPVDSYGRPAGPAGYQSTVDSRTSTTVSGGSSYYYDDYKHSSRSGGHKISSKNLAPAVVSSKRSKHRKQGMEQKISKFSPIEEARDVESDLASYTMTTSTAGTCPVGSRSKKLQDDVAYGMKKNAYDQQKYYGTSHEGLEEDDRMYSSGRSRSTGYGMDKISSRDTTGHRSKSYERDAMERSHRSSRSGRPPMRTQNSEEESPLSPVGKPVGMGRSSAMSEAHDVRNQYGSSHSLPDVQDHHKKDLPRSHVYKPDDPYLVDDMHCAVSDSEAYHLGQEETDWFEKPREARSDRSRHHGSGGHSSTGRRSKHTYHDYDEPPEEYSQQDEYNQRHPSSSSRDHRHHGSSSGRHTSSRHSSEDPKSSRSSRTHPKDPSGRTDSRTSSSTQRRSGTDSRSAHGSPRNSGDFSREPVPGHHHGTGGRSQRSQGDRTMGRRQDPSKPQNQQPPQGHAGQQRSGGQGQTGRHSGSEQLDEAKPGQVASQGRQPGVGSAAGQPATVVKQLWKTLRPGKMDATPTAASPGMKPASGIAAPPQPTKIATPPLTGIGSDQPMLREIPKKCSKAAPVGISSKPGGIGSAAAGQPPGPEGENVLTKILQGGAAEQAGKLGDALSGLGKKFTSFW